MYVSVQTYLQSNASGYAKEPSEYGECSLTVLLFNLPTILFYDIEQDSGKIEQDADTHRRIGLSRSRENTDFFVFVYAFICCSAKNC